MLGLQERGFRREGTNWWVDPKLHNRKASQEKKGASCPPEMVSSCCWGEKKKTFGRAGPAPGLTWAWSGPRISTLGFQTCPYSRKYDYGRGFPLSKVPVIWGSPRLALWLCLETSEPHPAGKYRGSRGQLGISQDWAWRLQSVRSHWQEEVSPAWIFSIDTPRVNCVPIVGPPFHGSPNSG